MIKIAHVEDCLDDHIILKKYLAPGFHIQHFTELEDLFRDGQEFDLIISDLRLKNTYEFETVQALRDHYPDTPILVLTGMGGSFMTGDLMKALIDNGANNVASKDLLNHSDLTLLIETLITRTTS